jgi:Ni/Fe-hydrogenase subunit HybB-like protein
MTTRTQPRPAGYSAGAVTKPPNWHALVAWDVLLNNLTAGLFLAAACGALAAPDVFGPLEPAAYLTALVLLLIDLVLLVLDLGDPLRFHHMLRVFKPTSPMSLGVWCLTAYSFPLAVAALLSLVPERGAALGWLRVAAVIVAVPPALGIVIYKGVLFSTTAQPVWRDARWLGAYLTASALALGCATLLGLAALLGHERAAAALRVALGLLLVLGAVPLVLLAVELRPVLAGHPGAALVARLGGIAAAGGLLVPLCLLLVSGSSPVLLAAVATALAGGLLVRYALVWLPHAEG